MVNPSAPESRDEFKIAIICALVVEAENVEFALDKCWEDEGKRYGKSRGDPNVYTTGLIGYHNVVLVHLSEMGGISTALAVASLGQSFPAIQLVLIVGVCGVFPVHPKTKEEIVLGDVVVSTAVQQYDNGKLEPSGFKARKSKEDTPRKTPGEVKAFLKKMATRPNSKKLREQLSHSIHSDHHFQGESGTPYPGAIHDHLYDSSYTHQHRTSEPCTHCDNDPSKLCTLSCDELGCGTENLVTRERHRNMSSERFDPIIHFGDVGSANLVLKSGDERDRLNSEEGLIAFEMEGVGSWDTYMTIVIKGACDYADSHKNKAWQPYAAMTAAACLRVILAQWVVAGDLVYPASLSHQEPERTFSMGDKSEKASQKNSVAADTFAAEPIFVQASTQTQDGSTMSDIMNKQSISCSDVTQVLQKLLGERVHEQDPGRIPRFSSLPHPLVVEIRHWLRGNITPLRNVEYQNTDPADRTTKIAGLRTAKALLAADTPHVLHMFPGYTKKWSSEELFKSTILSIIHKLILLMPESQDLVEPVWESLCSTAKVEDFTLDQILELLKHAISAAPVDTHLILLEKTSILLLLDSELRGKFLDILRTSTQSRGFKALLIDAAHVGVFRPNRKPGEGRILPEEKEKNFTEDLIVAPRKQRDAK